MFNIGFSEIVLILLIALLVIGPKQLPSFANNVGKFYRYIRNLFRAYSHEISKDFQEDLSKINNATESTSETTKEDQHIHGNNQ